MHEKIKAIYFTYIEDILMWLVVAIGIVARLIVVDSNKEWLLIVLPLIVPLSFQVLSIIYKENKVFATLLYVTAFLTIFWQVLINGMLYFGLIFSGPVLPLTLSSILVVILFIIKLARRKI